MERKKIKKKKMEKPKIRINRILSHLIDSSNLEGTKLLNVNPTGENDKVLIDGNNLTTKLLQRIGYDRNVKLDLTNGAWIEVKRSRDMIDKILERREIKYGLNTGFGNFANVIIPEEDLKKLQKNLILSHACGVGDYLSVERTRMLFALRINVLAKGFSGVSTKLMKDLLDRFNAGKKKKADKKKSLF